MEEDHAEASGLGELSAIQSSSVAVAAAKTLRNEILRRSDDDMFLGSEDDLIHRLGISRPTFRQAARLLEYEELLVIRRGVGGGFFGRRPSAEVVARMAGIFLLSQGASFADILRAQFPLQTEALRQIARNPDPAERAKLGDFLDGAGHLRKITDIPSAIRAINAFWRLVGQVAGNPALALFMQTSQAYGAKSAGLSLNAARLEIYVRSLTDMARAVAAADAKSAIAIAEAQNRRMISWTTDDAPEADRAPARGRGGRG
jgi:DNA-binding FadR family transcriptional regulator